MLHPLVASIPPVDDQDGVLISGVGPCEVTGIDLVGLAVCEPLMQVIAVHWEHTRIVSGPSVE